MAEPTTHLVRVFDMNGVQLYTFGKLGTDPGKFVNPEALCAHPNGNLLVLELWHRVQEVTWTGDHVRFICALQTHGWQPGLADVSPDGAFIAVVACAARSPVTVELFYGSTCVPVKRFRIAGATPGLNALRFSPDGGRVVVVGCNHRPTMFSVRGDKDGNGDCTVFGAMRHELQHVEFTDEGDVVVVNDRGATVYSCTTLEPARSWAWPDGVRYVRAIQAHRGSLYALYAAEPHYIRELHVYE